MKYYVIRKQVVGKDEQEAWEELKEGKGNYLYN